MRAQLIQQVKRPLQGRSVQLVRCASTQPPPVRPYRAQTEEERAAYRKPESEPETAPRSKTWETFNRLFNPFHEPSKTKTEAAPEVQEPRDPERGIAAAQRVVTSGVLDARYKAGARRWTMIIIGLVVTIGLTPEVWRRTMKGEKRKEVPKPKSKTEGAMVEVQEQGKSIDGP